MPLNVPKLDDRSFQQLVDAAKGQIQQLCPGWTDYNVSDPGITLIELFAYMIEGYLYRLNQVPEKNFTTFLNLLGTQLEPPKPATGMITFTLTRPLSPDEQSPVIIPLGTEVATGRTEAEEAVVFMTDGEARPKAAALRFFFTTSDSSDGTKWEDHSALIKGQQPALPAWPSGSQPAFLLGFENDLSAHTVTVDIELEGTAVEGTAVPWVWEVYQRGLSGTGWVVLARTDPPAGAVTLDLPDNCQRFLDKLDAKTCVRCSPGITLPAANTSPMILSVKAETRGITVPVTQAQAMPPEILGISDGQPSQKFSLANGPIVGPLKPDEVVEVEDDHGDWEAWTSVPYFGDSVDDKEPKKHYVIDLAAGVIEFGPKIRQLNGQNAQFGAVPSRGRRVRMRRYRVGGGLGGNVGANTVTSLRTTIPLISTVSNAARMEGGQEGQTLEDARLQALRQLRVPARAVTAEDFEYLALQVPGVQRVHCYIPEPLQQPGTTGTLSGTTGTVKLIVIPTLPDINNSKNLQDYMDRTEEASNERSIDKFRQMFAIPPDTKLLLLDKLKPCLLLTTSLETPAEPEYVWVRVEASIRLKEGAQGEPVKKKVEESLHVWLHPLYGRSDGNGWRFGEELTKNKVYARIDGIEGVDNTEDVTLWQFAQQQDGRWEFEKRDKIEVNKEAIIASAFHIIHVREG